MLLAGIFDQKLDVAPGGGVDGWLQQPAVPSAKEPAESPRAGQDVARVRHLHVACGDAVAELEVGVLIDEAVDFVRVRAMAIRSLV